MAHFAVKCGVRAFPSLACAVLEIDREGNSSRHLLLSASFSTLFGVPDATRASHRDRLEREYSAYSSSCHRHVGISVVSPGFTRPFRPHYAQR